MLPGLILPAVRTIQMSFLQQLTALYSRRGVLELELRARTPIVIKNTRSLPMSATSTWFETTENPSRQAPLRRNRTITKL
jgi:hypothetical protein